MNKSLIAGLVGIMVILAAPAVFAQGTPNLGSANVLQQGNSFMFDARVFDATDAQDTLDNAVYTPGITTAVNDNVDFGLMFSNINVTDIETSTDSYYYTNELGIQRKVLAPSLKWRMNGNDKYRACTLTLGADVVIDRYTVTSRGLYLDQYGYGDTYAFDDFIPAARLQIQWGRPGDFQFQIAGQANILASEGRYLNSMNSGSEPVQYDTPQGPGNVVGVGGGVVWPWSKKLSAVGDFMGIVSGHNSHCTICGQAHRQANIWSAGLNYACKDSKVSLYATNSLAPTLVDSLMASPGEITAVAARWSTNW